MHLSTLRVHPKFLVSRSVGGVLLLVAAAAVVLGSASVVSGMARDILEDGRVWRTGIVAERAEVQGTHTNSRFISNRYDLQVSYVDGAGEVHNASVSYELMFGSLDVESPVEVHFDPAAPDRVAVSWAQEALVSRWLAVLLVGAVMMLGFGGFLGWAGRRALQRLRDVRAAAVRPERQLLGVLGSTEVVNQGRPTGALRIEWASEGEVGVFVLEKGKQVLALSADTLVALRTPGAPGRPVVLHGDGYPYVLSGAQLAELGRQEESAAPAHAARARAQA